MIERVTSAIGKGLFAGLVGTAAMTLSSTMEAKLRDRRASETPAEAICRLLGVEALGEREKSRLTNLVHWGYGTGLGMLRGLLAVARLEGLPAAGVFFAAVWGGELVALPALDLSPPVTKWGRHEVAADLLHHAVYVTATSLAYQSLDRE
ncbi:MAG: DUF1440 domain-containing protein [Actinomycetota bacterium]|nr:DUF1440 domain-containing protein [Actinomycetota bacterium]